MNFVVLTAALSSANSGLYSTGRMLRGLAGTGGAPKAMRQLSTRSDDSGIVDEGKGV